MSNFKIAIVGATGLVGETILKILYDENLFWSNEIILFVSKRSAGKEMLFHGRRFRFIELSEKNAFEHFDFVFFSAGSEVSLKYVEIFAKNGAFVIDNSNAFRRNEKIPLVIPEINMNLVNKNSKIIANPNCSTIQLALVVDKLRLLGDIEKIVVSTYQSVSGAGRKALSDLKNNAKNVFKYGINDEIIAKIGEIQENLYSLEEDKIIFELNKILNSNIDISATAVRVPISICHGESVYVKFKNDISLIDVYSALDCDGFKIFIDGIAYVSQVCNSNDVYVFRIRQRGKNELEFFILADNLRRGAAFNAVMILKNLISLL